MKNSLAALGAIATIIGLTPAVAAAAPPSASAEPREIALIEPGRPGNFLGDRILLAGTTGFLHRYTSVSSPLLWTRYADGVTEATDPVAATWTQAGGDVVYTRGADAITTLDLGTMTRRTVPAPVGGRVNLYGDTMLIRPESGVRDWVLRRSSETVPVTGVPEGATAAVTLDYDTDGVLFSFTGPGVRRFGLLDLRTGVIASAPLGASSSINTLMSAGSIAIWSCSAAVIPCLVEIYPRADVTARPALVEVPGGLSEYKALLVGDHLIGQATSTDLRPPLIDWSAPGTPQIAEMTSRDMPTFRGGLFVGGRTGDWGVRRLTMGTDGKIAQAKVVDLTRGQVTAGLTMSHGKVRHIQAQQLDGDNAVRYHLFNHVPGPIGSTVEAGGELISPKACQAGVTCVRTVDSHLSGTSYLDTDDQHRFRDVAGQNTSFSLPTGPGATLVDASPRFVAVNSANGTQYLLDPTQNTGTKKRTAGAAGLWFDTLWTSPSAGRLVATNPDDNSTIASVSTGATCVPDEIQAARRHIYWSCGATGPAGVWDTVRRQAVALPGGRYLLGDGYAVRHDVASGRLLRYDLTGDTIGEPAVAATLPAGPVTDTRNITWAVDKYSGGIAWSDADARVHVVDPGIAPSAPAVGPRDGFPYVQFTADGGGLGLHWSLTRPVDSWKFTVSRAATGAVVATSTGDAARADLRVYWDGRLPSGEKALSGSYRYVLEATVGGTTTPLESSWAEVECGTTPYRSYSCNGNPAVLGVFKSGEAHWLSFVRGAVYDNGASETWTSTTAIVPFGDLNGDGHNDLLVRTTNGDLTVHHGTGSGTFGGAKRKVVGTGWGGFKLILSTGDLTGDGRPDVLAQDSAGVLRRFAGTAAGGLANAVVVPGTWTQAKVVGPGDVNGDGKADLYTVTSGGQLDLHLGLGGGGFEAGRRIGAGWAPYTLIGAGDADEDGRNDLVARDAAGTFWLYPGNGAGGFGTRKQLGTGFLKYGGLY